MLFYLLEVGTEEIPTGFINTTTEYLKSESTKLLNQYNLPFGNIITDGTPRRVYLYIDGISEKQIDKVETIIGPPAKIAFNNDGSLTDIAIKFAKNKDLEISTLKRISTPKGDYLQGEKKTGGKSASEILQEVIPQIVSSIPFKKSMRWGDSTFRFVRPIHWVLSILGKNILNIEVAKIKSSNVTYGHRFLAPEKIYIKNFEDYKNSLKKAYVIINSNERKILIRNQLLDFEEKYQVNIPIDEELLNTVVNLVEYPYAIKGEFNKEFLQLPTEVLITSMKIHQKYFPIQNKSGHLINSFIGISNIKPTNNIIKEGYERVLKARLNDAIFFFRNDKTISLDKRVEELKKVTYQEKLGTIYEKMTRFRKIAVKLSEVYSPDKVKTTYRTATIAKADLMSEMVYEFPELQGVMGKYYAEYAGEKPEIYNGIFEHYLPRFAGDILPSTKEGVFTSIGDKIDTIVGAFTIGMIPTGNVDPYGLRRATIGILSIIESENLRINLKELISLSLNNYQKELIFNKIELEKNILNFMLQRWKQILINKGNVGSDIFDIVSDRYSDPISLYNITKVLTAARNSDEFNIIISSFKRINNILKKNPYTSLNYDPKLFNTEEERSLAQMIKNQNIKQLLQKEKNDDALNELLNFAPTVNNFFDKVMVMTDDEKVRNNRLGLINKLKDIFSLIGNLDKIILT